MVVTASPGIKSPDRALRHFPAAAQADEVLSAGSGPTKDLIYPAFLPSSASVLDSSTDDSRQVLHVSLDL